MGGVRRGDEVRGFRWGDTTSSYRRTPVSRKTKSEIAWTPVYTGVTKCEAYAGVTTWVAYAGVTKCEAYAGATREFSPG